MSTIVIILLVIAAIMAIFLIAAAVSGKDLNIEKTITVNKPVEQVFEFVKYVKNHDKFSVWAMMDPDMKKEYKGADGKPGFIFSWDSAKKKNVGAGEQEILNINEGKSMDYELRFFRPMQDVAKARFLFAPNGTNQTNVQWSFYSRMKFPMNAMKPMIRGMLGKNLETGLQNLKTVMEKQ